MRNKLNCIKILVIVCAAHFHIAARAAIDITTAVKFHVSENGNTLFVRSNVFLEEYSKNVDNREGDLENQNDLIKTNAHNFVHLLGNNVNSLINLCVTNKGETNQMKQLLSFSKGYVFGNKFIGSLVGAVEYIKDDCATLPKPMNCHQSVISNYDKDNRAAQQNLIQTNIKLRLNDIPEARNMNLLGYIINKSESENKYLLMSDFKAGAYVTHV